jgi:hypothetical protein
MSDRQYVANLIIGVITGKLLVREAILHFPKDSTDVNIITAYHALIHYEADEDFRAIDSEYKEEQNNYLIFIAEILNSGKELPKNIVKSYEKYYGVKELPSSSRFKTIIKAICKFLNI